MKSRTQTPAPRWANRLAHWLVILMCVALTLFILFVLAMIFAPDAPPQAHAQSAESTPPPAPRALSLPFATITTGTHAGTVNLRSCPSKACPVIAILTEGETFLPGQTPGETWTQALTTHGQGWIYSKFVEVKR